MKIEQQRRFSPDQREILYSQITNEILEAMESRTENDRRDISLQYLNQGQYFMGQLRAEMKRLLVQDRRYQLCGINTQNDRFKQINKEGTWNFPGGEEQVPKFHSNFKSYTFKRTQFNGLVTDLEETVGSGNPAELSEKFHEETPFCLSAAFEPFAFFSQTLHDPTLNESDVEFDTGSQFEGVMHTGSYTSNSKYFTSTATREDFESQKANELVESREMRFYVVLSEEESWKKKVEYFKTEQILMKNTLQKITEEETKLSEKMQLFSNKLKDLKREKNERKKSLRSFSNKLKDLKKENLLVSELVYLTKKHSSVLRQLKVVPLRLKNIEQRMRSYEEKLRLLSLSM